MLWNFCTHHLFAKLISDHFQYVLSVFKSLLHIAVKHLYLESIGTWPEIVAQGLQNWKTNLSTVLLWQISNFHVNKHIISVYSSCKEMKFPNNDEF